MILPNVMEVMKGNEQIPFNALTQNIKKDYYIITYYLAEKLPDNVHFNLKKWDIIEYNENSIVVNSNDREWVIKFDNIYTYDEKLCIDYTFYTIRE